LSLGWLVFSNDCRAGWRNQDDSLKALIWINAASCGVADV